MAQVTVDVGEAKARMRADVRDARAARDLPERQAAAQALARHGRDLVAGPVTVAAHLSLPTEPGTDPLLAALDAAGAAVIVPRVAGGVLEWVEWRPDVPTTPGAFGIAEPTGPAVIGALAQVAVVFLPALSVDRAGRRLGQGGGFYDRALADVPPHADGGPLRVACVFDDEIVDEVPNEEHDLTVDVALTPSGVVPLG